MLRVRDIMTRDVRVVSPQTTVREAMELFAREHVSGAPVVSGPTVVGVVTTADLLAFASTLRGVPARHDEEPGTDGWSELSEEERELLEEASPSGAYFSDLWDDAGTDVAERINAVNGPEWNVLEEHDVSEIMTRELWTLPSDADARAAADLMQEHGIHRVLIMDDGVLAGIVSALDIARAAVERMFKTRTYVFNHDTDFR